MTLQKTTQHSLMPADAELHAYVDGELDAARRAQIDALLPTHLDLARQIDAIRAAAQPNCARACRSRPRRTPPRGSTPSASAAPCATARSAAWPWPPRW